MDKDFIIIEGSNVNDLIEIGLEKMGKTEDEVDIEVLEEGKSIVGITIRKCKVKITLKKTSTQDIEKQESALEVEKLPKEECDKKNVRQAIEKFKLLYKQDGVYLSTDNQCNLTPNLKEITKRLKLKQVTEVDYNIIKQTIEDENRTIVKIAPSQEEVLLDSRIEVEVTKDKMQGYIKLYPADGGKELTLEEILEIIKLEIEYGLDQESVKEAICNKLYDKRILVAEGTKPVDGIDGYIDYNFETERQSTPDVSADGSVDYRSLHLITNVNKGDILAEIHMPKPGSDGCNVLGEVLEYKPGMATQFNYGVNVSLSQDESQLITDIDGQVCIENKKVIVYELYTINGNVDNSTGDIDFNGNVKVNGNVLTGFKIIAKGNIEIDGSVEGATIESGGDLIITRGIQGYNKAKISSAGNISTRYIENADIKSEKNIEAEAIMHSDTVAGCSVIVGGKKGLLVGGSCKASHEISAKVIGSSMATATILEVGLDTSIREDQEKLKELDKQTKQDIDKFKKMISHLTRLDEEGKLEADKKEMLNQSVVAKLQLQKKEISLANELEEINQVIEDSSNGKITVEDVIYSAVKVTIGNSTMMIREKREHCTIYRDIGDGDIKFGII